MDQAVPEHSTSRFSLRQPPAGLLAMICLNIAVSAGALMCSPWRMDNVRALFVFVAAGDDSRRIRDDGAVVEKHVDVVLRRQQRADVALQYEVRTGWCV